MNEREFAHMIDAKNDINTGFYIARPTQRVKHLFSKVIQMVTSDETLLEQQAFNALFSGMYVCV
jgi:hypothetical protein